MNFGIKDIINDTTDGIPNKEILDAVNKIIETNNNNETANAK